MQTALSFFITSYRELAEWRAVIQRLSGFEHAAASRARGRADAAGGRGRRATRAAKAVALRDLDVRLPSGVPLLASDNIAVSAGDRVLVTGPSGAGKSTLFRAIAGIWPFGSGRIDGPEGRAR